MTLHNDLQPEFKALAQRLAQLETTVQKARKPRLHIFAIAIAFVLGGILLGPLAWNPGARATQEEPRDLAVSALRIVNGDGKTLLSLGGDADGGVLKIFGRNGKQRMFVGVSEKEGGGIIGLQDPQERYRSVWDVNNAGRAAITMSNADGKAEVYLGASAKDFGGLFNLNDPAGVSRVIMDVSEKGNGALAFCGPDRKNLAFLGASSNGWGGLLNLNGTDGNSRLILDVGEKGEGRLGVFNADRNREVFLGVADNANGGLIVLSAPDGRPRMFLEVTRDGAGYIQTRDSSGAVRNELK